MSAELLLIDLSSITHALYHQSANEPDPNWTANRTVARVHALASGKPSGVAVCLDTPPYFRKDIDPDYKANRQKEHNAAVSHQIAVAVDALKADGFPVWGAAGYEADDIIATAVEQSAGLLGSNPYGPCTLSVTIASADKDLYQLISDRVTVQKLSDGSRWDAEMLKEKAGIVPNQMVDYLALCGDTSDNIVGAKGIGPKGAAALLTECGNLDDLYAAIDGGMESEGALKPAMLASLKEFRPRLETVRNLIRLRTDAPIPFDEIFKERVPMEATDERGPVLDDPGPAAAAQEAETVSRPVEAARPADVVSPDRPATDRRDGPDRGDSQPLRPAVVGPPDSTALAPVEWEKQLEPRDIRQLAWYAQRLFASRLFGAYGTPEAVMSTILAGRELGFPMMTSLRAFHIIENKPTLSAGAIHSLILKSGQAKYFRCTERTATRATFETQRGDDPPFVMSYTIEEAQQAWSKDQKAWVNSGWGRNPADMLVARCSSKLARLVYPDVTMGLYSHEEL